MEQGIVHRDNTDQHGADRAIAESAGNAYGGPVGVNVFRDTADDLNAAVDSLVEHVDAPLTDNQRCDALRKIQRAQDALDAVKATHIRELYETAGYETEGASSIRIWCRNELRLDGGETNALCAGASTMRDLPEVRKAARDGAIRASHIRAFTYGVRHIGSGKIAEASDWLLDVAQTSEPAQLHRVVRAFREAVYPESLDEAWARGMDREDFQVNSVPDGWHINGFVNTDTGAKLCALLDSMGAPREAGDERSGSQRRVDALDGIVDSLLSSGMPSDKGVRPHISVLVDAQTLAQAGSDRGANDDETIPAQLLGFGAIGPKLLGYLTCESAVTPILTDGQTQGTVPQTNVLDVGRTSRLATPKQRQAVIVRQHGECAAPGCTSAHLEIHHSVPWSDGGHTDLDNLIGLCPQCHRLVHRGSLQVCADNAGGFSFAGGGSQRDEHRARVHQYREAWRQYQQGHQSTKKRQRMGQLRV